jgi:hypothetical protein
VIITKEKATWQAYKDKRADDFKKLVSPDLVAMNANGVTNFQDELETMSKPRESQKVRTRLGPDCPPSVAFLVCEKKPGNYVYSVSSRCRPNSGYR